MSKMIEIRQCNKTVYKIVPDNYIEAKKETPQRDLTTGGGKVFSFGMTKEEHKKIFKKQKNELTHKNKYNTIKTGG